MVMKAFGIQRHGSPVAESYDSFRRSASQVKSVLK